MFVPPEVTNDDVAWVCGVMKLPPTAFSGADGLDPRLGVLRRMDTVDIEACPGSGKTTLLVAKLAILARRWPSSRAGMCILSHTNAARDEIAQRLSACSEGTVLLRYPHFVGTIHAFANEFLALPYLRSIGNPVKTIDNDIAIKRRWSKVPYKTKLYLDTKAGGDGKVFLRYARADFGGGRMSELGEHTPTFKIVRDICEASSKEGYFCYEELFVWARKLLDERPAVALDLRKRFPLLFIDEVQDNDEEQSALLHNIFCDGPHPSTRQRFGDSNQAIYNSASITTGAVTDAFPGPAKVDLPNSFRFGADIAALANPFGVAPQGLVGLGPDHRKISIRERPPAIFLFDEGSVRSVLPEYGKYLTEHFTEGELQTGIFTAVAGVHKGDELDKVPRWMGHYAPSYNPEIARRDPLPKTYSQFVMSGWKESQRTRHSHAIVRSAALAMLELLRLAGHDHSASSTRNPHAQVLELLSDSEASRRYRFLTDVFLRGAGSITAGFWNDRVVKIISAIAAQVLGSPPNGEGARAFLTWTVSPDEADILSIGGACNVFRYPDAGSQFSVRLGSIHSVKGETHWSTLVLDTYYYAHHLSALKPWLLGTKSGGAGQKVRMLGRLRLHYVAMTRPSHLLCLAMRSDALTPDERLKLIARGWTLRDCPAQL